MELRLDFPGIQTRLNDEEIAQIAQVIKEAKSLSMGPQLKNFEEEFKSYLDVGNAYGVSSATAALELSAVMSGIKEGEEVLIPSHTFTSSALPFLRRKAKLVFVDIDPKTFVMDVEDLKRKITNKSRVVVPVHLYGVSVDMDPLMDLAKQHNLTVIEDCAQAMGTSYKGRKVGTIGDFGCFSFHGQKNITTLGEGGMLVTRHDHFDEKILGMRKIGARPFTNQDKYWKPAMSNIVEAIPGEIPCNYAMGEIQAKAGSLLLNRVQGISGSRLDQYNRVKEELNEFTELSFQHVPDYCEPALHLLPARYTSTCGKHRDDLIDMLFNEFRIKTVVQYYPLNRYELFINNGAGNADCPETDKFFDNMISFPFHSHMKDEDVTYLIESLKTAMTRLRN